MKTNFGKMEAATRQLDIAIGLLFAAQDPLAIRTLAGAANELLADLVERNEVGDSWRSKLIAGSGLSRRNGMKILNLTQNFLKHADRDPDSELELDEEENDHLIFVATLECGQLGHPLSMDMQLFQIWYLAMYPEKIGETTEPVLKSRAAFSDLSMLTRQEKLRSGAEFVYRMREKTGWPDAV